MRVLVVLFFNQRFFYIIALDRKIAAYSSTIDTILQAFASKPVARAAIRANVRAQAASTEVGA